VRNYENKKLRGTTSKNTILSPASLAKDINSEAHSGHQLNISTEPVPYTMRKTKACLLVIVFLTIGTSIFGQSRDEKKRIQVAEKFILSLKNDLVSNEELMSRFVAAGCCYFNKDSIRRKDAADEHLTMLREWVKKYVDSTFHAYKYKGHEDEFAIMQHASLDDREPKVPMKLKFTMDFADRSTIDVDPNDVYVFAKRGLKGEGFFILFDTKKKNKILSFTFLQFRNNVGFWQW
jgi:hypothetical protein